jgi:hypothetical protein
MPTTAAQSLTTGTPVSTTGTVISPSGSSTTTAESTTPNDEIRGKSEENSSQVGLIAGVVSGGVVVIVVVLVLLVIFMRKRRIKQQYNSNTTHGAAPHYDQIELGATSPYSNALSSQPRSQSNFHSVSKGQSKNYVLMTDVEIKHKLGSGQFGGKKICPHLSVHMTSIHIFLL